MTTDLARSRDPHGPGTASGQIADSLWTDIQSGRLGPGAKLPSERELVATYGVARNTARAAIRHLIDAGLVVAEHGRGVFVRTDTLDGGLRMGLDQYTAAAEESFQAEVSRLGGDAVLVDLGVERVTPPAEVAERLAVRGDRKSVVRRCSITVVGSARLQYEAAYIPWELAKGTDLARAGALWPWQRYELFEEKSLRPARVREEVFARMPTPSETAELNVPDGVAVLELRHTSFALAAHALEVTERIMRGDSFRLDYWAPLPVATDRREQMAETDDDWARETSSE